MLEEQQIETTLIGEIADHFTVCGDDHGAHAGLEIDHADQRQGEAVIHGYDRESQTRFSRRQPTYTFRSLQAPPRSSRGNTERQRSVGGTPASVDQDSDGGSDCVPCRWSRPLQPFAWPKRHPVVCRFTEGQSL